MPFSVLGRVEMAPRDPIFGITEAYNADKNPEKVNLGVGVYFDENGKIPLLECVKRAEQMLVEKLSPRGYLPIDGIAAYDKAVQQLVLGAEHIAITEKRAVTVQTLGGTGGLKVAADFLKKVSPDSIVWISDPSWENHRALFEGAGFEVKNYPYYDAATHGLNFAGMRDALNGLPQGAIVVLHACCHNPTGVDLSDTQWSEIIEIAATRGLIPILDIAYQGFGDGLEADGAVVRRFAERMSSVFISNSFSKSFSLYGERIGALTVIAASTDEAARALSQLKRTVRTNYSNPPTHGAQIVTAVLTTPDLRTLWEQELGGMRVRIRELRKALVERLKQALPDRDFSFVVAQRGMFSYSGLTKASVEKMATEHSVYAVDTGRICVAALSLKNIDRVVAAIAESI